MPAKHCRNRRHPRAPQSSTGASPPACTPLCQQPREAPAPGFRELLEPPGPNYASWPSALGSRATETPPDTSRATWVSLPRPLGRWPAVTRWVTLDGALRPPCNPNSYNSGALGNMWEDVQPSLCYVRVKNKNLNSLFRKKTLWFYISLLAFLNSPPLFHLKLWYLVLDEFLN